MSPVAWNSGPRPDGGAPLTRRIVAGLRRPNLQFYVWVLPALAVGIAILVPFGMTIYYSLTSYRLAQPWYEFVWFENYASALHSPEFWRALRVTSVYAAIVCAIEIPLGFIVAYLLVFRCGRFSVVGRVLLILPMMIPPAIGGLLWQILLNPSSGIYSVAIQHAGIDFKGFASSSSALGSVVAVDVWLFTPFVALILVAGMSGIPSEFLEAAAVDGAGAWTILRRVILPVVTPVLILVFMFRLIDSLRMFDIIYVTTQGGPGTTLMTLSLEQYVQTFQFRLLGYSLPYTLFLWLIVFAAAQVLVPLWTRSITRYSMS